VAEQFLDSGHDISSLSEALADIKTKVPGILCPLMIIIGLYVL
jgi:hypothetical protein